MYQTYQIQSNDTLASIAGKFNTNIDDIRRLNGFGFDYSVLPGNYIVVPKKSGDLYMSYIVEKGDSLYSISQKTGVDIKTLLALNGLDNKDFIYPGQEILIPDENVKVYLTEQDTLNGLVDKLGVSLDDLIGQNDNIYLLPEQIIVYKKTNFDNL